MSRPEDDELDERPKSRRRRDDDEDDEDDDRPQRRRPRDEDEGDGTGGLIPLKNPKALAAYYCGVFSLIPVVGCVLGPVAVILGILGFMHVSKYPKARGTGHAVTGIILGIVGPFVVGGIIVAISYLSK